MSPRSGRADGGGGQSQRIDVVVRQTRSPPKGQEVPAQANRPAPGASLPRLFGTVSCGRPRPIQPCPPLIIPHSLLCIIFHRQATISETAFPAAVYSNSCTNFGPLAQGQPSVRRASRIRCRPFAGRTADAVLSRRQQFQRYCSCLMAHNKSRPQKFRPSSDRIILHVRTGTESAIRRSLRLRADSRSKVHCAPAALWRSQLPNLD